MKPISIFILLLWFSTLVSAQKEIRYTVDNGLPSNHVYKVAQDNEGFIWILTDKGMVRFDGTEFKVFTTRDGLPVNDIWDIRFTPDDRVWFFTRASKLGYIQGDQVFSFPSIDSTISLHPATIFQEGNNIFFSGGLATYRLSAYPTSHNSPVWVSDTVLGNKRNKFIRKQFARLQQKSSIYHCSQINDSLILALGESRYVISNLHTEHHITHRYDEFDSSLKKVMFPRFNVRKGVVQIYGMGFSAFLEKSGNLTKLTKALEQYGSHAGFEDINGNLWIATIADGVVFIPASRRQANYPIIGKKVNRFGLANNQIIASLFNKGFYAYDPGKGSFNPLITGQGAIYSVFAVNQSIYYLTDKKYIKITEGQKEEFPRSLQQTAIFDLLAYKDTLFGLGSMLLAQIDKTNFDWEIVTTSVGLSDFLVYQDRLIFASSSGLMEYQNGLIKKIKIGKKTFDKPSVHLDICMGKLVISTDGFGAYITDLQRVDSLPNSSYLSVQSSFSQANNLWLATNTGVLHYVIERNQPILHHQYTLNDGLLANSVSDVLVFGDSMMVSSDYGVSILPLQMRSNWNSALSIRFKDVFYNDLSLANNTQFSFVKNNQLKVSVASIDYAIEKNKRFEYRLLPIIKEWQISTTANLSFSNLPPKKYQLEIRKGDLNQQLRFWIKPLWYQTAFAKILFALCALTGIIFGARMYNRYQLRKQERRLSVRRKEIEQELYALRSQMNPHFVFNSLNAIQYYMMNNDLDLSEKYLVDFSRLIRMFFNFSRKRSISLKEEIQLIESYLGIEKMRFGEDLEYELKIDPMLNLLVEKIPTMLLQPVLENAVNHGVFHKKGVGHVLVQIDRLPKTGFKVAISDDGIGWANVQEVLQKSMSEHDLSSTKVLLEKIDLLNQSKQWDITFNVADNQHFNTGTTIIFEIKPKEKSKINFKNRTKKHHKNDKSNAH